MIEQDDVTVREAQKIYDRLVVDLCKPDPVEEAIVEIKSRTILDPDSIKYMCLNQIRRNLVSQKPLTADERSTLRRQVTNVPVQLTDVGSTTILRLLDAIDRAEGEKTDALILAAEVIGQIRSWMPREILVPNMGLVCTGCDRPVSSIGHGDSCLWVLLDDPSLVLDPRKSMRTEIEALRRELHEIKNTRRRCVACNGRGRHPDCFHCNMTGIEPNIP